jgi:hypothetical protein
MSFRPSKKLIFNNKKPIEIIRIQRNQELKQLLCFLVIISNNLISGEQGIEQFDIAAIAEERIDRAGTKKVASTRIQYNTQKNDIRIDGICIINKLESIFRCISRF